MEESEEPEEPCGSGEPEEPHEGVKPEEARRAAGSRNSDNAEASGSVGAKPVTSKVANEGKPARFTRKKRRRAVRISRADQQIIDAGGVPSWEQIKPLEIPKYTGKHSDSGEEHESARDRAIRAEKPPHW